jgi:hypothetical protein
MLEVVLPGETELGTIRARKLISARSSRSIAASETFRPAPKVDRRFGPACRRSGEASKEVNCLVMVDDDERFSALPPRQKDRFPV